MAVGIKYYGRGSRPMSAVPRETGSPFGPQSSASDIPYDLSGNPSSTGIDDSPSDSRINASSRLAFDREKFNKTFGFDKEKFAKTQKAASDKTEFDIRKFLTEQQNLLDEQTRKGVGAQTQESYLRGLLTQGVSPAILSEIAKQETTGQNYINEQAKTLIERLTGARDTSQATQTAGFDALKAYLAANPAQAYANAQRQTTTPQTNALAQYLQAQGVDPAMSQSAVEQANIQAAGGASNYNQLLNVLGASEASGQASRLSEEQMARSLAGSQLQSIFGAGRAGIEGQQAAGLNELATQISNARIGATTSQEAQNQAIQNALATLYGTGLVSPPGTEVVEETVTETPEVTRTPIQILREQVANTTDAKLKQRVNAYIRKNPSASLAQIEKTFPKLAAAQRNR